MKKYVLIVLAMTTILLVGTGFKLNGAVAADHDPAGPQCQSNCFWGYVYVCAFPHGPYQLCQGCTMKLYKDNILVDTRQTDDQGKYCFCKPMGGWTPGIYVIKTGRCQQKEVYREGDGDIQVDDWYLRNPETCPTDPGPVGEYATPD